MPGTNAGTGQPLVFRCHRQRRAVLYREGRATFPDGHKVKRTGRTRDTGRRGVRSMREAHEYRCECGHVGWSKHRGVLFFPLDALTEGNNEHDQLTNSTEMTASVDMHSEVTNAVICRCMCHGPDEGGSHDQKCRCNGGEGWCIPIRDANTEGNNDE